MTNADPQTKGRNGMDIVPSTLIAQSRLEKREIFKFIIIDYTREPDASLWTVIRKLQFQRVYLPDL